MALIQNKSPTFQIRINHQQQENMSDISSNIQALPIHQDYQVVPHLLRKVEENEMDYDLDDDEELEDDIHEFLEEEDEEISFWD